MHGLEILIPWARISTIMFGPAGPEDLEGLHECNTGSVRGTFIGVGG